MTTTTRANKEGFLEHINYYNALHNLQEYDEVPTGPTKFPPTFVINAEHINKTSHMISTRKRRNRRVKRQDRRTKDAYQAISKPEAFMKTCKAAEEVLNARAIKQRYRSRIVAFENARSLKRELELAVQ
ncbi:hypothetical protein BGW38_001784 [Lunasporangiospora selenospora]|uniref:Uncharacterized protein n=1 Tax=Lunasporangiospora selenospora TaxID=979761 RepID=A0A9P6KE10_9FUNG|nr:hypothetical protein BGW38_001784 [Lunasporangiospora selenospora]